MKRKKAISPFVATALLLIVAVVAVVFSNTIFQPNEEYPKEYESIEELNEIPLELYHYVKDKGYNCKIYKEEEYYKPEICCEKFGEPIITQNDYKNDFIIIMNKTTCIK